MNIRRDVLRYKDLSGKEIVNINHGKRLGILGQTDLEIDKTTGHIQSFIIPSYKWFGFKKEDVQSRIYWKSIKKIGEDMIMIESDD